MSIVNWKERCKEHEIVALSYMTKDISYINRFLAHGQIGVMKEFFSDEDCLYIFELANNYRIKFNEILIKETFEDLVNSDLISKTIDESKRIRLLELFDEIISEQEHWKPEQYSQMKHEWFQVEIAPKLSDLLREEKTRIDSFKTFQVFANIKSMINRYESLIKAEEGLRIIFLNDYIPVLKRNFNEARLKGNTDESIKSGIASLDNHLVKGFCKGKLSLIGGMASSGKTTLAVNIATNMMRQGKKVVFVSLEMSEEELLQYMISRITKIPYKRLADPNVNDDKYSELINLVYEKIKGDFCIVKGNAGAFTWEEIETKIEQEVYQQGFVPDCIIIDYLALIALPKDGQRRDIQLGDLAKKMRTFAEQKNSAVITLVQANRQSITKDPKTGKDIVDIRLENIEDSNKVGQDADMFLTINQTVHGDNSVKYTVWIKKQRGGKREIEIELDSDMRYYWIMDQEGMYTEPYALGKNPTKEERELYNEATKIDKKDSEKIETGIDEYEKLVDEKDFDFKTGDTSGVSAEIEDKINESSYDEEKNSKENSISTLDFINKFNEKIENSKENISKEKIIDVNLKIDFFEPDTENFHKSTYDIT